ncbi:hypothetical protein XENTR_v10012710 [Xenopus tropicalis]|nr:hypothetical protein XENTR_v10012710 [Xenopus tropicalis]
MILPSFFESVEVTYLLADYIQKPIHYVSAHFLSSHVMFSVGSNSTTQASTFLGNSVNFLLSKQPMRCLLIFFLSYLQMGVPPDRNSNALAIA